MDYLNYENIFTKCLTICENIDDNSVHDFFPKLDKCLEISENIGREKVLFQKSLLGLIRRCRKDFLRETKMSFNDVTEIANYFSEYIRDMMNLDGIQSNDYPRVHESNIDKRASCNIPLPDNFMNYFILLILLILSTCLLGCFSCWICALTKKKNDCTLILPKDMVANLALTCQEMGLDPCEMRVLKEKTCFDKEYENIVNKYLKKKSDSTPS